MAPESLTALPSAAATRAAPTPAPSVGSEARTGSSGRRRERNRNTRKITATGMAATQNDVVDTRRLAMSLRSTIESSGPRPSLPTRSNSRPRWARSDGGRARSAMPKPKMARAVTSTPSSTVRHRTR
jgi:hypothetical protein